ncbi:MAG: ATP-binding cassette domain-containing protein, partial [Coprobacillus sp.]
MENILKINNLDVSFKVYGGNVKAVRHLSMDIHQGEVYALVGESGCGKSTIAHTILRLNDLSLTHVSAEEMKLSGIDILNISESQMEDIRGSLVSMIFQDPITSLNPTMKIGKQIVETLYRRKKMTAEECKAEAIRLLKLVQI